MLKRKPRRKNRKSSSEIDNDKKCIYLSEDSLNIAYWVYTDDNQFYDKPENKMFLIKSMVWSLVIGIAQLLLMKVILDDWTDEMITLSKLLPIMKG